MKKYLQVFLFVAAVGGFVFPYTAFAAYQYVSQFGSAGTGDGQLQYPKGIFIATSTGNIYVVDTNNDRIQVFDSSGVYLSKFGTTGSGNGEFSRPYGVALDSSGNIYVLDTSNNRIQKFNSSGVYQSQFGTAGSGNGELNVASAIAIDSSGNIYVVDTNNHRIQKFNSSGVYQSQFGTAGSGNGELQYPRGIVISTNTGNIYVADSGNNRIQKFNSSGVYQSQFGTAGSGNGEFSDPRGIQLSTTTDDVYVLDYSNNRVEKFDSSGVYQSKFGSGGSGDGQLASANYFAFSFTTGDIYISDNVNHRIQKFSDFPIVPPTLTTSAASSILATSATLNGEITDTGYEDATQHGFAYGTSADLSTVIATTTLGTKSGTGAFTSDITGLTEGTTYYVRAYATNSSGTGYGSIETFDTATIVPPTLTTSAASSIFATSATLNGEITDIGYEDATQHGFAYGTSADLSTVIATTTLGTKSGTGAFTSDITGLTEGTTYYVRAYAINSSGTGYGSIETFSTGAITYVSNCTELQAMSDDLDGNYILTGNIDCSDTVNWNSGEGFDPVGTNVTPFTGSLDGAGYTISNLTIDRPAEDYVGLFGSVDGSTFQNFTITGTIEGGQLMIGALAGEADGIITVDNVSSSVDIISNNSTGYAGGLFGEVYTNITITDSSVTGDINLISPSDYISYVGGLVGSIDDIGTVSSSSFSGEISITSESNSVSSVGGLMGEFSGSFITNSFSTGSITIIAGEVLDNIGGIVGGTNNELEIDSTYNTGNINITVDGYINYGIAGLVGYMYYGGTITDSYNTGNITIEATDYVQRGVAGLVGSNNDDVLDVTSSYNTGDISVTAGTYINYGVGGLVGYFYYGGNIVKSYSISDITINAGTYVRHIGGLWGFNDEVSTVTNSFSQGNISVTAGTFIEGVGGLYGDNDGYDVTANNSYTSTNLNLNAGEDISYVGGFGGGNYSVDDVINSFSAGIIIMDSAIDDISVVGGFNAKSFNSTTNNFYDKTASGQDTCTGDGDVSGCTAIENNSSYFLGNNTNEPMASWNFSTVWSTVSGKLPILTSLASPYTILTTSSASSVTKTGAVLNATISTLSGGSNATVRGFAWGTSSTYSATTTSSGSFSTGAFTTTLSDLTCNTTYHFRAYATNPSTTGFSSDATFTTEACATASSGGGGGGGGGSIVRVVPIPTPIPTPASVVATSTPAKQTTKLLLNLKLGDSNPEVTTLQTILASLGFLKVSPTGYFGPLTETALKAYQVSKGISPVGLVGPLTRASLNSLTLNSQTVTPPTNPIPPATTTPSIYTRNLDIGSTGDDVRSLQSFLTSKGYTVPSTGYFGPLTQSALAKFQKDNGISPAVGYFGPVTRGKVR